MSEETKPCCAHLAVSYRTEPCDGKNIRGEIVPNGAVRGWWECDSNCGTRFGPRREIDVNFIDDPRKWRISMDGYTIKTGWADEKQTIARYPYAVSPIDNAKFQEWLETAEQICTLHNMALDPASYNPKEIAAQIIRGTQ